MDTINKKAIEDLSALLKKNDLKEIEYEEGTVRIRVVAKGSEPANVAVAPVPSVVVDTKMMAESGHTSTATLSENQVKSPMVGVVYLSTDPNSPTFVNVGDFVGVGQTLCLIEAMKTFNPVKATKAGKIKRVLVESGVPVEFNQPLFILE